MTKTNQYNNKKSVPQKKIIINTPKMYQFLKKTQVFISKKELQWNLLFKTTHGTTKSDLIWQVFFDQRYEL